MSSSNQQKPAIEVKGLTKTFKIPLDKGRSVKGKILGKAGKGYREFTPLNDISFTVYEGDFFGIVGRNGSGKSTLLKTIAGIYEPTAGKVQVNGKLVPFIELGVGFNPNLSGRENVYLNAALLGFSRDEIDDMYDDIVDFAELHDFMEERLQNYSSGMQVRLAFSISIRARGDILLLDEVLAVGDAAFQRKCFDYFEQLKREKKTVILVTHSMSNVERFCNRGLLLNNGRIETIGSSDEVASRYRDMFSVEQGHNGSSDELNSGKAMVKRVDISQQGGSPNEIKTGRPFSVEIDVKLLEDVYTDHNLSIYIRNSYDTLLAFSSTRAVLDRMFQSDQSNSGFTVKFTIDDNIYSPGEYYIDLILKSANSISGDREQILNMKKAARFSINSEHENHSKSLTQPRFKVEVS